MDDLLALLEENTELELHGGGEGNESQSNVDASDQRRLNENQQRSSRNADEREDDDDRIDAVLGNATRTAHDKLFASVDQKVGIRMKNRRISGAELFDLCSGSFYTPAVLCSMSIKEVKKLIQDEGDKQAGRSNITTVGIIFSNSGTRISSSGNAYCMLKIGTLASGPALSVLLFGSPYHKHCKVTPGSVILLANPRISYSKDTMLTVSDERQCYLVAEATDFAFCKAMVRAKVNGQWVNDGKPCRNHVDRRQGEYCHVHKKQQQQKSAAAMQQLRAEQSVGHGNNLFQQPQAERIMTLPKQQTAPLSQSEVMMAEWNARNGLRLSLNKKPPSMKENVSSSNSILNPRPRVAAASSSSVGSVHNPYHQSKTTSQSTVSSQSKTLKGVGRAQATGNPYTQTHPPTMSVGRSQTTFSTTKRRPPTNAPATAIDLQTRGQNETAVPGSDASVKAGDWLLKGTKPRERSSLVSATSKKRRSINTQTLGFDGSVPIPQPKLMHKAPIKAPSAGASRPASKEVDTFAILYKQRELAKSLQGKNAQGANKQELKSQKKASNVTKSRKDTAETTLFDQEFEDEELDRILASKSRFAHVADAEQYVRSRNRVEEMGKEEIAKERKTNKSSSTGRDAMIKKEWFCQTCNRSYSSNPVGCQRNNHHVKVRRTIQEKQTTSDERLELSLKDAKDGGLKLGAGLDWSRLNPNNRFS